MQSASRRTKNPIKEPRANTAHVEGLLLGVHAVDRPRHNLCSITSTTN